MTCSARRYSGNGKPVRENRYLGGWAAFARAHSMQAGCTVIFECQPDTPNKLRVSIAQPPDRLPAGGEGAEVNDSGERSTANAAEGSMAPLTTLQPLKSGKAPTLMLRHYAGGAASFTLLLLAQCAPECGQP